MILGFRVLRDGPCVLGACEVASGWGPRSSAPLYQRHVAWGLGVQREPKP